MTIFAIASLLREVFPGVPQGNSSLNFPRGIPYYSERISAKLLTKSSRALLRSLEVRTSAFPAVASPSSGGIKP